MKTYNAELMFNNDIDKNSIIDFLSTYTLICNRVSQILFDNSCQTNIKLVHHLCYKQMRLEFPSIPAQAIIKAYKDISASYKSIKSNKHKITEPIIKKNISMRLDKRLYSNFSKLSIKLTNPSEKNKRMLVGIKSYKVLEKLFDNYMFSDPLIFIRNNKIFLSITFKVPDKPLQNEEVLGIDLGLRRLIVTSEGNAIKSKEYLKHKRRIRYNKRMLNSKKTKSAKRKLKTLKRKERNFSKNYIHLVTNEVLKTEKGILVLEDLSKIKEKTKLNKEGRKRTKHNNRMGQVPFFMFKEILSYKALHTGKRVETVSPFMTSQNDCRRQLENGERKGCRYYTKDGLVFDADWNAAINIANKFSKHPISYKQPVDGGLHLIGRLTVKQPIVLEKSRTSPSL